jgi:hypothetical protein
MKDNNSDKLILPLDDFGVIKKYQTKESNKECISTLCNTFTLNGMESFCNFDFHITPLSYK